MIRVKLIQMILSQIIRLYSIKTSRKLPAQRVSSKFQKIASSMRSFPGLERSPIQACRKSQAALSGTGSKLAGTLGAAAGTAIAGPVGGAIGGGIADLLFGKDGGPVRPRYYQEGGSVSDEGDIGDTGDTGDTTSLKVVRTPVTGNPEDEAAHRARMGLPPSRDGFGLDKLPARPSIPTPRSACAISGHRGAALGHGACAWLACWY